MIASQCGFVNGYKELGLGRLVQLCPTTTQPNVIDPTVPLNLRQPIDVAAKPRSFLAWGEVE